MEKKKPTEQELQQFRPIPFYFITTTDPDALSYEGAYAQLRELKADGFGGIVLFNKPPHGFDCEGYLSNAWFDMVKNFVKACDDLGLSVWINDGFDFPPGDAGKRINPSLHPHLAQKRIVLTNGEVEVKETDWGFPAFEEPESAELFHKFVYEPTKDAVGAYFGTTVKGIFSDADNRRVNAGVFGKEPAQKDYFPWSSDFEQTFSEIYGYNIQPYLKDILLKKSCPQAKDYWEHAGRLYQAWFSSNCRWCHENGLEYTFHTSDSSPYRWSDAPRSSPFTEGRALDMESIPDYPGTDQELLELNGGKHMRKEEYWVPQASWGSDDARICNPAYRDLYADLRTKQPQSAAFLEHKKGVMCEMFAASNWGASFTQLREIAARQIMQGVTFIVPHAYHHRMHGETKYFAPPDFSPRSHLAKGMRKFNDLLATYCYNASRGTLQASVAVLDITDDIWIDETKAEPFFDACLALDRMPCGYVIADDKRILRNKDAFSVILNTGAPLSKARSDKFSALGLPIVTSMDALIPYTVCGITYEGEGTPHFMRRKLEDGSTLLAICNLEQEGAITGQITIDGKTYPTQIHSGEIAFFTAEGQIPLDPVPAYEESGIALPKEAPVSWEKENVIPLEWWLDETGSTATKCSDKTILTFPYTVSEDNVGPLTLTFTDRLTDCITAVKLDGKEVPISGTMKLYDDTCTLRKLPPEASAPGEHTLTICKAYPISMNEPIYLFGNFGASVKTEEDYFLVSGRQYSLNRFIPRYAHVTLFRRPEILDTTKSFTEQGHPFYSGSVTYRFSISLSADYGEGVLHLPAVRDECTVILDGKVCGSRITAPYTIPLGTVGGNHTLDITVHNTLGNMLEFYRAPSGLLSSGEIHKAK